MVPIHSKTVQSALERRLAFELTVSKISSRFVMLSNDLTQSIPDVSQLPADAASEKEILESQDIKTLIVLPINVNDSSLATLG